MNSKLALDARRIGKKVRHPRNEMPLFVCVMALLSVLLCWHPQVVGDTFANGMTNTVSTRLPGNTLIFDSGEGAPTTVNFVDGAELTAVFVNNTSVANLSNGSSVSRDLNVLDNSTAHVCGGSVSLIDVGNVGHAFVDGGSIGEFGCCSLRGFGAGAITVTGGLVTNDLDDSSNRLWVGVGDSTLTVVGGMFSSGASIYARFNSQAFIHGGHIDGVVLGVQDDGRIILHGHSFTVAIDDDDDPSPPSFTPDVPGSGYGVIRGFSGTGTVSGTLSDGSAFAVPFFVSQTSGDGGIYLAPPANDVPARSEACSELNGGGASAKRVPSLSAWGALSAVCAILIIGLWPRRKSTI